MRTHACARFGMHLYVYRYCSFYMLNVDSSLKRNFLIKEYLYNIVCPCFINEFMMYMCLCVYNACVYVCLFTIYNIHIILNFLYLITF